MGCGSVLKENVGDELVVDDEGLAVDIQGADVGVAKGGAQRVEELGAVNGREEGHGFLGVVVSEGDGDLCGGHGAAGA